MSLINSVLLLLLLLGVLIVLLEQFKDKTIHRILSGLTSMALKIFLEYFKSASIINKLGRHFHKSKASAKLPELETTERINKYVYRVMGLNPGPHTLQGTNTYLILSNETEGSHILLDTGEDWSSKQYVDLLFNTVFPITATKSLSKIILTHGHEDHIGGIHRILTELSQRNMLPLPTVYKRYIPHGKYPAKDIKYSHIVDKDIFPIDPNTNLTAIYTPGHTDDHVAFLFTHIPHENSISNTNVSLSTSNAINNAIFTGDCVLGCGTTVFDDLYDYMQSLTTLRNIITNPNITENHSNHNLPYNPNNPLWSIYPGHGPVIADGLTKIDEYISHRTQREQQILQVLQDSQVSEKWWTSLELVDQVYGSQLSIILKLSAQANLSHHLKKLQKESKVKEKWPDLWAAT